MKPLQNCRLLYTRSQQHFPAFQEKIIRLGGKVWHLPLMDTAPLLLSRADKDFLQTAEVLLFTSANAARHLLAQFSPQTGQKCVAIGEKTALFLQQNQQIKDNLALFIAPPPFNSEALLAAWQPRGQKIALIAAAGGRKLLLQQLQFSNTVREVYCYQRFNPSACFPVSFSAPDVITIASKSTLNNLIAIIPQSKLKLLQYQTCIAALSAAVARYAAQHGFEHCIFSESAAESDQIEHICRWWNIKK